MCCVRRCRIGPVWPVREAHEWGAWKNASPTWKGVVRNRPPSLGEVRADIRDLRAEMNRRFDQMDTKFSWLIGVQFTTVIAAIAALLNGYFR
jgi:hypothetical protein